MTRSNVFAFVPFAIYFHFESASASNKLQPWGVFMSGKWFGPKAIGWGVSPTSWEGWLLLAVYLGLIVLIVRYPAVSPGIRVAVGLLVTAGVLGFAYLQYQSR